jgi:hypothetical protein
MPATAAAAPDPTLAAIARADAARRRWEAAIESTPERIAARQAPIAAQDATHAMYRPRTPGS